MGDRYPSCRFKSLPLSAAKIANFPRGQKSVLKQLDFVPGFNLADKALLYKVNVARDVVRKNREKHDKRHRSPAVVRYDTNYLDENNLPKTLNTGQNAEQGQQADRWRNKTKHRTVTSEVQLFADGFGTVYAKPISITVTTGCAPNLMGTSQADEKEFLNGDRLKNPDQFKKAYKKLFLELLTAQDESGVNICVLPFIGGDLYMNRIGNEDKSFARRCALEALSEVLEDFRFTNIEEVIFAAPDKVAPGQKSQNSTFKLVEDVFANYNGRPTFTVANVDMLHTCAQAKKLGKRVGMINAGSDRTLGGSYKHTEKFIKQRHKIYAKSPAEELLFNLSDAAQSQAVDQGAPVSFKPYTLDYQKLDTTPAASESKRSTTKQTSSPYIFSFVRSDEEQEDDIFEMEGIYKNIPVTGGFAYINSHFVNLLSFKENISKKDSTYLLRFSSERDAKIFEKYLQTTFLDADFNRNKKRITVSSKIFEHVISDFENPREIFDSPLGEQLKAQLIADFVSAEKQQQKDRAAETQTKIVETETKNEEIPAGRQTQKEEKSENIQQRLPTSPHFHPQVVPPRLKKFNAKIASVETIKISERGFVKLIFNDQQHFNDFKNQYLDKFQIDYKKRNPYIISLKLNEYQRICKNSNIKFDSFVPYHRTIDYNLIFTKIDLRIDDLKSQRKDPACFGFFQNLERKKHKIDGLKELKTNLKHYPELSIEKHLEKIKIKYPDIDAGFFSRQTKHLLEEIQDLATNKLSM